MGLEGVVVGGGLIVLAAAFSALLVGWGVESVFRRRLHRERRAGRQDVFNWQEQEGG